MPCFVLSSFLVAFVISPSMSTQPLTRTKTAASADMENATQPEGRRSVVVRIDIEAMPLPESERIDWSWAVTVSCAMGVYV